MKKAQRNPPTKVRLSDLLGGRFRHATSRLAAGSENG